MPGSRDAGTGLRDTVVEPDVAVLPAAALDAVPEEDYLPGAPPLAVEVVSTTDRLARVTWKAGRYLLAGAELVWVLNQSAGGRWCSARDVLPETLPENGALDGEESCPASGCLWPSCGPRSGQSRRGRRAAGRGGLTAPAIGSYRGCGAPSGDDCA